ncbi:uncharacterized protein M6B38_178270 [Iris pallida]|uniref:Uncharacterized protein n=1 Tax=Iris pallida TaxID=29817 RepID=A0AAX6EPJ3_IRIPA|nr:uncharacterized protein M6B38_178270 [Iris pallida]
MKMMRTGPKSSSSRSTTSGSSKTRWQCYLK